MFKRVFAPKRVDSVSKSIRVPVNMWSAIEKLAKENGETPNSYIVLILDQFLQIELEQGNIEPPEPNEAKTGS